MKLTFKQLFEGTKYSKEDALARAEELFKKKGHDIIVLHKKDGGPNEYEVVAEEAYLMWPTNTRERYNIVATIDKKSMKNG